MTSSGYIWTNCDHCRQVFKEDGDQYMTEEAMLEDHLCPDCAGLAELVALAEGEGAGEVEQEIIV